MFDKMKDRLFWKSRFNEFWKNKTFSFRNLDLDYHEARKLDEKKYIWRERLGVRHNPEHAVFYALKEFCDEYRLSHRNDVKSEPELRLMAYRLQREVPWVDEEGGSLADRASYLGSEWGKYLEEYRADKELWESGRFCEAEGFKFSWEELDGQWERLLTGQIPFEAHLIWQQCQGHNRSASEIAGAANKLLDNLRNEARLASFIKKEPIDLKAIAFWVCLFERHLFCDRSTWLGEATYFTDGDDGLGESIAAKLGAAYPDDWSENFVVLNP